LAAKVGYKPYFQTFIFVDWDHFLSILQPQLLLFLDEPTSGLDSQSAWAIMAFLRDLADNGQAILCT
jgi:ABC-type uncharacterized transport system ATPase subunit